MKNLKLIIILFCCFVSFSFQESNIDTTEPKPEQIKELLTKAEGSIDMMEFDKAQEQLNKSLDYAKQIDHKPYIALTSGILARMYGGDVSLCNLQMIIYDL